MSEFKEIPGTQIIRWVDVLILGPVMIKASQSKNLTEAEQAILLVGGVGTVIFNGANIFRYYYFQNQ